MHWTRYFVNKKSKACRRYNKEVGSASLTRASFDMKSNRLLSDIFIS
jgi:hypothetical protein